MYASIEQYQPQSLSTEILTQYSVYIVSLMYKGPRILHTLQKLPLSCKRTTTFFFRYWNDCSRFFFVSNDFLTDFFRKIFAVSCVVCKGLNRARLLSQFSLLSSIMTRKRTAMIMDLWIWIECVSTQNKTRICCSERSQSFVGIS